VLFDGWGEVGPALHRGIVGHNHTLLPVHL
jgi:hypothetical protein